GPFPTELTGALGDRLRGTGENPWDEYGTTTGRPRRCGWLDAVSLRYAARLNGMTEMFVNKLDVLSGFDKVKIHVAYTIEGKQVTTMPYDLAALGRAEPVYLELSGWNGDITGARQLPDLPAQARAYVEEISRIVGVTVTGIGVGPARDQMILV